MSIFRLASDNPEFSYIIRKNPATQGPFARCFKTGTAIGWFSSDNKGFTVLATGTAAGSHRHGPVSAYRVAAPMFPVFALDVLLTSALRTPWPTDQPGHRSTFEIPVIAIEELNTISKAVQQFPWIDFSISRRGPGLVGLAGATNESLRRMLNAVYVLCTALAASTGAPGKYPAPARIGAALDVCDAPYEIRRMIANGIASDRQKFDRTVAPIAGEGHKLLYGDRSLHRLSCVVEHLNKGGVLLHIGSVLNAGAFRRAVYDKMRFVTNNVPDRHEHDAFVEQADITVPGTIQRLIPGSSARITDVVFSGTLDSLMPPDAVEPFLTEVAEIPARRILFIVENRAFCGNVDEESGWSRSIDELRAVLSRTFLAALTVEWTTQILPAGDTAFGESADFLVVVDSQTTAARGRG